MRSRLAAVTLATLALAGCDWNTPADYNPKQDFQAFLAKQEEAKKGTGGAAVAAAPGKQTYETYCAACHGIDGKADGPSALALNPRPRNFHEKDWQAKVDDGHIFKVIKEGGPAVGLSASMAPWGAAIPDDEIKNVVQYVRQFGK